MPPENAIDKSPYKAEIIKKLLAGESGRSIERWLENTHGEEYKISYVSINKYKKFNLDIVGKAKKKVEKRKAKKKIQNQIYDAVDDEADIIEEVDDSAENLADGIELLKNNIKTKAKIVVNTDVGLDLEKETLLQREKFRHEVKKSANDDIKILHEIYKDDPKPPDVNVYINEIAKDKNTLDKSRNFLDDIEKNIDN